MKNEPNKPIDLFCLRDPLSIYDNLPKDIFEGGSTESGCNILAWAFWTSLNTASCDLSPDTFIEKSEAFLLNYKYLHLMDYSNLH